MREPAGEGPGIRITGETRLLGVMGDPIEHSLSPVMQNAALARLGLPFVYVPLRVSSGDVAAAVRGLLACSFHGFNVTIPHKEAVARLVDVLHPSAARVGAVNTVVREANRWVGWNTDGEGFLDALEEAGHAVPGRRVLLLGAGGAARALAFSLLRAGARELWIVNRNPERARALGEDLRKTLRDPFPGGPLALEPEVLSALAGRVDLLVNTIPPGRFLPPDDLLQPPTVVCDIVYRPRTTPLLARAAARGCPVVGGAGMLVHQGARAFEIWTGRKAPVAVMREAVERALGFGSE